jgi:hypothetical protein
VRIFRLMLLMTAFPTFSRGRHLTVGDASVALGCYAVEIDYKAQNPVTRGNAK